MLKVLRSALVVLCVAATSVGAVEPDEVLQDPVLETRARELSKGLRCLVCQNESIDESHAPLARDLRLLVRERLVAGDSDDATIAYIVQRYGEFVLLEPTTKGANILLWLAGPAMLGGGLIGSWLYLRRRSGAPRTAESALSAEEKAKLDEILKG